MLAGYSFMKTSALHFTLALGLLLCGVRAGISQQLSSSAPIIISLSQIDHYGVSVMPGARDIDGAKLGLPYQSMNKTEVDALVRDGLLVRRSVWIMDGQKIIAKCNLVGEYGFNPQHESETKYGLLLGFMSVGEARQVGAKCKRDAV